VDLRSVNRRSTLTEFSSTFYADIWESSSVYSGSWLRLWNLLKSNSVTKTRSLRKQSRKVAKSELSCQVENYEEDLSDNAFCLILDNTGIHFASDGYQWTCGQ